ncbi:hypothetical protein BCR44DRAFT_1208317 [Catenaria anguillulae PL171]|uniref:Uncharacterized protein n=1 Tax=Catenaria anguillulae PL171 TaxID=765915 RepID=A0A1Y2HF05_9FUNG|nr:hypothetical protein BCR44DRAFT_1208317 [Catenaria anguillulae PL171]
MTSYQHLVESLNLLPLVYANTLILPLHVFLLSSPVFCCLPNPIFSHRHMLVLGMYAQDDDEKAQVSMRNLPSLSSHPMRCLSCRLAARNSNELAM